MSAAPPSPSLELDHVFVFVEPGGASASEIAALGLREGARRTHRGQGTSNVCFMLENAFVELIWASDREEISSEVVRPVGLDERSRWRETGASPFGICLRPAEPTPADALALPFETWAYRPPYVPAETFIPVVPDHGGHVEPVLFVSPVSRAPAELPPQRRPVLDHPGGFRLLTAVELQVAGKPPMSSALATFVETIALTAMTAPAHHLTLEFDGGEAGRQHVCRTLPLTFRW